MKSVKETDISIISQEIFQHDPSARVENLKVSFTICVVCGLMSQSSAMVMSRRSLNLITSFPRQA